MLSKNDIKNIKSLEQKKFRTEKGLFIAQGHKLVGELLGKFECVLLAATSDWMQTRRSIPAARVETVTPDELKRASLQQAPQDVLAVFRIPQDSTTLSAAASGIKHIFCSKATADIYNPKAIQATMGAIARVSVHYTDLGKDINGLPRTTPVYGTFLEGDIIYDTQLTENGVIVMGNEGNGIGPVVAAAVNRKLYIPNWPQGAKTSESLNVAIATAVVCSEFRRRSR